MISLNARIDTLVMRGVPVEEAKRQAMTEHAADLRDEAGRLSLEWADRYDLRIRGAYTGEPTIMSLVRDAFSDGYLAGYAAGLDDGAE